MKDLLMQYLVKDKIKYILMLIEQERVPGVEGRLLLLSFQVGNEFAGTASLLCFLLAV